jgi:CRISPR-associated protein Csx17
MKAIGLLRIVSEQLDPDARGTWDDEAFTLIATPEGAALERFLLDRYQPLPVFNPWNSGAGFDAKSKDKAAGRTLDAVAATTEIRWEPARNVLRIAREVSAPFEAERSPDAKAQILRTLRARYPDDALIWLDAAVVVGRDELEFPRLLGTGGNDGRLDFSVNFLQRALDVVGPKPLMDREALLRDAFHGTADGRLSDVSIGQYAPANAGGVNASTGFEGLSLVNPWDFVFLIEGLVVFAGSMSKRFGARRPRAAFPFTFAPTDAGYGAASTQEEKRAEIWLPRWRGAATLRAVKQLIRTARVDVETSANPARPLPRAAGSGIEAAQAALTRGVASGIDRFERVVIAQRNGLAFSAVRVGSIPADKGFPAAAALAREATRWVNRLRNKELQASVGEALSAYDLAVFRYAGRPDSAVGLQEWVAALGSLDIAVGHARIEGVDPFEFRDEEATRCIAAELDDGSSEHALAAGFASVGGTRENAMRLDVSPIRVARMHYSYDPEGAQRPELLTLLASSCVRRVREARERPGRSPWRVEPTVQVTLRAIAAFLDGAIDERRLARLLKGYVLLPHLKVRQDERTQSDEPTADLAISWCAAKVLFDGFDPVREPLLATEVPQLLLVHRTGTALQRMYHDLAVSLTNGLAPWNHRRPRDFRFAELDDPRRGDSRRVVAALLLPLTSQARKVLIERVLQPAEVYR